jgi:hypothetical protein
MAAVLLILNQVFSHEVISRNLQVSSKTFDILPFEKRSNNLAAICTLSAIDLARHCLVVLVDDRINFLD